MKAWWTKFASGSISLVNRVIRSRNPDLGLGGVVFVCLRLPEGDLHFLRPCDPSAIAFELSGMRDVREDERVGGGRSLGGLVEIVPRSESCHSVKCSDDL